MAEHKPNWYADYNEHCYIAIMQGGTALSFDAWMIQRADAVLSDLEAMRVDAGRKAQAHNLALDTIDRLQNEREEKDAELDRLRKELHQTEIERNMASDCIKADGVEIERLRKENTELQQRIANQRTEIARIEAAEQSNRRDWNAWRERYHENTRLRKALEILSKGNRAPGVKKIAMEALNPQPATEAK